MPEEGKQCVCAMCARVCRSLRSLWGCVTCVCLVRARAPLFAAQKATGEEYVVCVILRQGITHSGKSEISPR